jgi:signal transduction histidine kinase/ActR/RegA family two-component response regulator
LALVYRSFRLRTKFLLSLLAVTSGLTAATLYVVSYSVEKRIRESLREELHNSVKTYETFAQERESSLVRSAQMLANLPNVRALMTTEDAATIQDESASIWRMSGADLLVLANRSGEIAGLQTSARDFSREQARESLRASMQNGESRNWWFGGGHLYEVWLQPIYFGAAQQQNVMGVLAVGHEINENRARDFSRVVESDVIFRCGDSVVASTVPGIEGSRLTKPANVHAGIEVDVPGEFDYGRARYLATTVNLSAAGQFPVTLTVLKSLDQATIFLRKLNRILLGLGLLSVLAGGLLVFLLSHTFTRPLANLVAGVHALEQGNFDFPLELRSKDEVGEVTGAFDRMRHSMRKTQKEQKELETLLRQAHKMEAVGRLAGGVAHDFNNLLTIIRGNSDLLLDRGGADEAQLRYAQQIQKAADRAVSMTRQLLAFSRMQVLQPRVLDLNTTISEMGKMIPRLIGEHIEFSFLPNSKSATVLADPGQMEQVFLNLAVNARDAMPNGGKLTVQTHDVAVGPVEAGHRPPMTPGEYVLLCVADTGQGMSPETKAHIFEPFFTTKDVGKGTGLGLATVYGIIKQTGGFIWVESAIGKGTRFEIYLPHSTKDAPLPGETPKEKQIAGGKETILVVEDEPGVRKLASEFLRSGGYNILEAAEGADALRTVNEHHGTIDILLTDIVMPGMSGAELAEALKKIRPAIRVIYMSGYAEFSGKNGERVPEATRVLQKPFSRNTLLEKVREAMCITPCNPLDATKVGGPA